MQHTYLLSNSRYFLLDGMSNAVQGRAPHSPPEAHLGSSPGPHCGGRIALLTVLRRCFTGMPCCVQQLT